MRGERPVQVHGVEARAVGGVRGLKNQKHRDGVHGIFEAAFQKAGAMRVGDDPSIAQADVPCACVAASAGNGMAAAGPDGDVVPAGFGGVFGLLCGQQRRTHAEEKQCEQEFLHDGIK